MFVPFLDTISRLDKVLLLLLLEGETDGECERYSYLPQCWVPPPPFPPTTTTTTSPPTNTTKPPTTTTTPTATETHTYNYNGYHGYHYGYGYHYNYNYNYSYSYNTTIKTSTTSTTTTTQVPKKNNKGYNFRQYGYGGYRSSRFNSKRGKRETERSKRNDKLCEREHVSWPGFALALLIPFLLNFSFCFITFFKLGNHTYYTFIIALFNFFPQYGMANLKK